MSLKSYFKDICNELENIGAMSREFANLNNDEERFSMAYELCQRYFSRSKLKCNGKSNENSITFRKEGNNLFQKQSYWKALELYTKSIAFACKDSEELCLAFGNRASCLLRLNYEQEALRDVETALSLCNSSAFAEKLSVRKEKCLAKLKNNTSIPATFGCGRPPALTREKSSFFDSASNVLELSYDLKWERKLIANDDIKVGEVLLVETPYSSILLPGHIYTHCSNCFKRCLNLVPCVNCTTAMYCTRQCLSSAKHTIECSYLNLLSSLNADRKELLSLKILNDASNEGKDLEKLYADVEKRKGNNDSKTYSSSDIMTIYNLVTNTDRRSVSDLFYRSIVSAILISVLESSTCFFNGSDEGRKSLLRVFCGGLILRFMQSLPCNAHEVSEYCSSNLTEIGAGAYATLSLINHSCDPNVVRYSCQNKIVLKAIKPISKGEQILDNYGYHYATHTLEERQKALLEQYHFKCECEPCISEWPLFTELVHRPLKTFGNMNFELYQKLTKKFEEDLQLVLDGDHSNVIIERNIAYLHFLHENVHLPWKNYNKCQELLKHCFNFFYNYFQ